MSDPSEESLDPTESAVRDLLASARESSPMPEPVASMLDARLAELVAERESGVPVLAPHPAPAAESAHPAPATESAHPAPATESAYSAQAVPVRRRRSRMAGALLGAAAAVVVGGVALTQVPGLGPGDGSSGDSAVSAQDESAGQDGGSEAEDREAPADGGVEGEADGGAEGDGDDSDERPSGRPEVATVSSATLVEDLVQVRAQAAGRGDSLAAPGTPEGEPGVSLCLPSSPLASGSVTVPVLWDGDAAVVVLEPQTAAGQPAQVRTCGTRPRVREVVLPPAP